MCAGYGGDAWESPAGVEAVRVASWAYYATQLPDGGPRADTPLLVALHGWGQNCQSFLRRFRPLKAAGLAVVAPQGPHQMYLDRETRKVGFSWLTTYDRRRAVPDLAATLDAVLDTVRRDTGIRSRPCVLGFSQGVSIAYRYALLGQHPVAGVVACGGDLPPDVAEALPARERFAVLLVHGDEDEIVRPELCDSAEESLAALGWPVETHRFTGGHEIPPSAVERIGEWSRQRDATAS